MIRGILILVLVVIATPAIRELRNSPEYQPTRFHIGKLIGFQHALSAVKDRVGFREM